MWNLKNFMKHLDQSYSFSLTSKVVFVLKCVGYFIMSPAKGRETYSVWGRRGADPVPSRPVPSVPSVRPVCPAWAYPTCSFLSMHAINLRLGRDRGHIKYMRLMGCDLGFNLWPWPCDPHKHIFGSFLAPKWCFLDLGLQLWTDRKPYVNFLFQLWTLT